MNYNWKIVRVELYYDIYSLKWIHIDNWFVRGIWIIIILFKKRCIEEEYISNTIHTYPNE